MAGRGDKKLRTGFSTGTAATAAAAAALQLLLEGNTPARVVVALPGGGGLSVEVAHGEKTPDGAALATVVKDAGDDPDVTHKARVTAQVALAGAEGIALTGGPGVGRVTRPGLPVQVGEPAINPVPRQMISRALADGWAQSGQSGPPRLSVEISVADGEALARRTLNPRLGILGGLSILGTTGLVKPFSHEAYTATIDSALAVAKAAGLDEVVLTTGGKSEKLLQARRPDLPEMAFVQIADFFGHALKGAGQSGFRRLGLGCFFGKAVKQAQGLRYTHAHTAPLELAPLAGLLAEAGAPEGLCREVARANTARHALDMLRDAGRLDLAGMVGPPLLKAARAFAGPGPDLWAVVMDFDGTVLYEGEDAASEQE